MLQPLGRLPAAPPPAAPRAALALAHLVRDVLDAAIPVAFAHPMASRLQRPILTDVRFWRGCADVAELSDLADALAASKATEIVAAGPLRRGAPDVIGFAQARPPRAFIGIDATPVMIGLDVVIRWPGDGRPDFADGRPELRDPTEIAGADYVARVLLHELAHLASGELGARRSGGADDHSPAWRAIAADLYRGFRVTPAACLARARIAAAKGAPMFGAWLA